MAAQSVASRTRRDVQTEDAVMARAIQFSHWARRNIRWVIALAVVTMLVVGGLIYWRLARAERLERAAAELMQVEQTVASGNTTLAIRDVERFVGRFGGTPYGDEARVMLGRLYLEQNQPAQAVEALQPLGDDIDNSIVGPQGALLLAAAHQAGGNTDAAIQTYLSVAEQAELSFRKVEALTSAALLREQANDFAGAAELYQRAAELTPEGTLERSLFEMRRAEAEARAAAPR